MRNLVYTSIAAGLLLGGCTVVSGGSGGRKVAPADAAAPMAAAPQSHRDELAKMIGERFADPSQSTAHFGVFVQSTKTGEVWFEHDADKWFMPASNEKIPTVASSFLYFGSDYKFETIVGTKGGTVSNGELNGDLVVYGTGDPTIYNKFYSDSRDVFRQWADKLKERGITHITGNIIGDDNAWYDRHLGYGWPYEGLNEWYYAEFGPLSFNENYVDFKIVPPKTAAGEVEIIPNVPSSYYTVVNNIRVVESGNSRISASRPHFENEMTFTGQVRAGSAPLEETVTITNPTLWYVWVLKEVLEEQGIRVDGTPLDCDAIPGWDVKPENLDVLIRHESPPMKDMLAMLAKRSQNMYAENMEHAMGWKATGKGTFDAGRNVVFDEMATLGVEKGSFEYNDGSGLSRYDYISPHIIGKIFAGMLKSDVKDDWWNALAVPGEMGTLRNRLKGRPSEKRVRGKTGTISNVRSLSGYVTTADDEILVFSFLCNGHSGSASDVDKIYDDVLDMLATYSDPSTAAN